MTNGSGSNKYRYRKKDSVEDQNVLGIVNIDAALMDIFCAYAMSQNASIHKHDLVSLNTILHIINENHFKDDQVMLIKYKFITEVLYNRLRGVHDRDLLLSAANKVVDVNALIADGKLLRELSDEEVTYVKFAIGEIQNNLYMYKHMDKLKGLLNDYSAADFRDRRPILKNIKESVSNMLTQFRKNDVNDDSADTIFRLSDMESAVTDIHKQITSPTFKLITGMQGLNAMLGGGFEAGNVYSFFGLPGEGKTVTLENILAQLWKYNQGYQCRDRTKRPCIILLTMENFVRQTVCALFHILTKGKNMRDCQTAADAVEEFKRCSFQYDPENNNSIEIVIKYRPINSVTTDYLYKMVDDLADEGYETIAFLQDYVKRILPVMQTGDPFQDLGNVINDFKTFATLKRIPVITASQLNRDAAKIIDEGRNANKLDLMKKLGRANIGESVRIDENLDGTFIITPEISSDGKKYMGFKLTKHRYEIYTSVLSIYQPFYEGAQIAMIEDVYEVKPAYRESLLMDAEEIRQSFGDVERASINRTVKTAMANLDKSHEMLFSPIMRSSPPVEHGYTMQNVLMKKEVVDIIDLSEVELMRSKFGIKKFL